MRWRRIRTCKVTENKLASRISRCIIKPMANLDQDIAFYESKKNYFETDHMGEWVLVCDLKVISFYSSFELAAEDAVKKFGSGPYLIRQIGATPIVLPVSVMYNI